MILLGTTLFSCEKETSWYIQPSGRFIVADCIITSEYKNQTLKLYYSSDSLNQLPEYISGAQAEITDGSNTYIFEEDTNSPGNYLSTQPFMATAGNSYRLTVAYGDVQDTAWAEMAAINPMETLEIVKYDTLYRFVYNESSSPSMLEVSYDWSAVPGYCDAYGACIASETFYTLDIIDVSKEFAPDKLIIGFPRGTQIIRRKYSLSDEHQQFIRVLLLETEWRGGIFDTEQGNVPTNFTGKIRGWFAACMVLSDTTKFD